MEANLYTRVFGSPEGQRVLEDLNKVYKKQPANLDLAALSHLEGERSVVRFIEQQIKRGSKE